MKKLYSKQLGSEVYALAPEQLKVFASSGYEVPTPEAVIADAGAIRIVPPAGKRAYAVFKFTTGAFVVRTSAETLTMQETGAFVGEVMQAAIVCKLAENIEIKQGIRPHALRPLRVEGGNALAHALAAVKLHRVTLPVVKTQRQHPLEAAERPCEASGGILPSGKYDKSLLFKQGRSGVHFTCGQKLQGRAGA